MKISKKMIKIYEECIEEIDFPFSLDEVIKIMEAYKKGDKKAILPLITNIGSYCEFSYINDFFKAGKIKIDVYQLVKDTENVAFLGVVIRSYLFSEVIAGVINNNDYSVLDKFREYYLQSNEQVNLIEYLFDFDKSLPANINEAIIDFALSCLALGLDNPENIDPFRTNFVDVIYFLIPSNNTGASINKERNKKLLDFVLPYAPKNPLIYWNSYCLASSIGDIDLAFKCIENTLIHKLEYHTLLRLVDELQSDCPETQLLAKDPRWEAFKTNFINQVTERNKPPKWIPQDAKLTREHSWNVWILDTETEYKKWTERGRLIEHRTEKEEKIWFDNGKLYEHRIFKENHTKEWIPEYTFYDYTEWYDDGEIKEKGTKFAYENIGKRIIYRHPKAKDNEKYHFSDDWEFGENQWKVMIKYTDDGKMISYHIYDKNNNIIDEMIFDKPIKL
ncbi:hypothetical protein [Phocoenobacter skyensis]|uniref:Uncharacterized protein n=1 Tax=Phocoenobacter skyensis TaxID=97481 RepID=A0AAJ6NEP0_9PAST|nr:hypothetical protein [Pasteurella skyensis]MDP8175404.1 hypothetical protein [Pasteurella skyensis]